MENRVGASGSDIKLAHSGFGADWPGPASPPGNTARFHLTREAWHQVCQGAGAVHLTWVANTCGICESSDPPAAAGHRHSPALSKPSLLRL